MVELTGTEKQIEWANKIRAQFLNDYSGFTGWLKSEMVDAEEKRNTIKQTRLAEAIPAAEFIFNKIHDVSAAQAWIDARNDLWQIFAKSPKSQNVLTYDDSMPYMRKFAGIQINYLRMYNARKNK